MLLVLLIAKNLFWGRSIRLNGFILIFRATRVTPVDSLTRPQPAVRNQLGTGVYRRTRKSILGLHCYIFSTLQKSAKFDLGFSRVKTHTHILTQIVGTSTSEAVGHFRL